MKQIKLQNLVVFTFATYLIAGYPQLNIEEDLRTINTIESVPDEYAPLLVSNSMLVKEELHEDIYGAYTKDIEEVLAIIPVGSEVYLEETNEGGWYLKVEKTFSSKKESMVLERKKEEEIDYSIYGEIITI